MSKSQTVKVTVSNRTVVRVLVLVILTFLAFRFVNNVAHALQLIFIAFFLSLALNPAVSWIARKLQLKSRATATGIAYLVVVVVLGAFLALVVPPLVQQTVDFVSDAPQTVSSLKDDNSGLGKFVKRYNLEEQVDGLSNDLRRRTRDIRQPVITTAGKIGSALIATLTVFVLTFMMLVEGPAWIERYWKLQPSGRRERQRKLAQQMYRAVTGYVNGQVILSALGAVLTLMALLISSAIFNVSVNALALAGITFVTGLIPMIGNILGGIIVVLACLFVSWPLALTIAIFKLLHQQIENVTFQPYIQAKFNELTPLLVFVAALLGIGFGGLMGAFIAIPAASCAKILLVDYLDRREEPAA